MATWLSKVTPLQQGLMVALTIAQFALVYGSVLLKERLAAGTVLPYPIIFALYREVGAGTILLLTSSLYYGKVPQSKDLGVVMGMGFSLFSNQLLYLIGLDLAGVTVATCMQPSIPVITVALALVLKQESSSISKVAGIIVAASGAIAIVYGSSQRSLKVADPVGDVATEVTNSLTGSLLLFGNCFSMSVFFILSRSLSGKYPSLCITAWAYGAAAVWISLSAMIWVPLEEWVLPATLTVPLMYWVFISSIACYSVMTFATRHLPASQVSAFVCLQPFIGTLMAVIKLGEQVTKWDLGGVGVIAGLVLVMNDSTQEVAKQPSRKGDYVGLDVEVEASDGSLETAKTLPGLLGVRATAHHKAQQDPKAPSESPTHLSRTL